MDLEMVIRLEVKTIQTDLALETIMANLARTVKTDKAVKMVRVVKMVRAVKMAKADKMVKTGKVDKAVKMAKMDRMVKDKVAQECLLQEMEQMVQAMEQDQ